MLCYFFFSLSFFLHDSYAVSVDHFTQYHENSHWSLIHNRRSITEIRLNRPYAQNLHLLTVLLSDFLITGLLISNVSFIVDPGDDLFYRSSNSFGRPLLKESGTWSRSNENPQGLIVFRSSFIRGSLHGRSHGTGLPWGRSYTVSPTLTMPYYTMVHYTTLF